MSNSIQIFALSLAIAFSLSAQEPDIKFTFSSIKSNYFAGEEACFSISKDPSLSGRVMWNLASGFRTVARGEKMIEADKKGNTTFSLSCQLPPVKDGVIFPVDLNVSLVPYGGDDVIKICRRIWLFPPDAGFGKQSLLKKMKIRLFDPMQSTHSLLAKAKIPFKSIHTLESLASLTNGTVIVGSGLAFQEYRNLSSVLINAAQRGVNVLLLSPQEGTIPVPLGNESHKINPHRFVFEGSGIIRNLDKRLDSNIFEGKRFMLDKENNIRVISRDRMANCWQWIELDYSPSGGKFVICGFDIIKKRDSSPTSRYLLLRILEYLCSNG